MPANSQGLTRRRLLGSAATAGGLAAAATILPPHLAKAAAAEPRHGGHLSDIEHVVILMQENRSFDHYFGTLSGVRGFDDPRAPRLPNGRPVFYQPDAANPDGYLLPYRLNTRLTAAQAIPSTSHAWGAQHAAWNAGKMDSWMPAHRAADGDKKAPYVMGYLTRDDIPFHYALADAFTICDAYHCSVLGPTHPNRYMHMTGTIDPDGLAGGPALDNGAADNVYSWTTYPERLEAAGVSWKFYHEPDDGPGGPPTGLPPLSKMTQYQAAAEGSPLYDKALASSPVGQFEYDALNDTLPTVSWLFPPQLYDEHPARMPAAAATWLAGKIEALATNPEVWAKTVFILNYDENDGLFDHVAPTVPPAGTAAEFVTRTSSTGVAGGGLPVGLGYRVPALIISPWTVGGWVASETFDHTSVLQFLEKITGVSEPNISQWRRRTCGDLTSTLRMSQPRRSMPDLPGTAAAYSLAQYEVAHLPLPTVPAHQEIPHQEHGHRPRI
ncbi:alkaline phosphatase family protein [Streptomyces sp. CA-111067]|uniref:alkaline phosphatase family protein n=1 Tax=Streptomyces sp. CA-111067 TaxID=3240046 RepID=UPI003D9606D5